eukprot:6456345-Pyramimonas_sp.AAC.1
MRASLAARGATCASHLAYLGEIYGHHATRAHYFVAPTPAASAAVFGRLRGTPPATCGRFRVLAVRCPKRSRVAANRMCCIRLGYKLHLNADDITRQYPRDQPFSCSLARSNTAARTLKQRLDKGSGMTICGTLGSSQKCTR